jgi:Flp pilus assembly protein TadD
MSTAALGAICGLLFATNANGSGLWLTESFAERCEYEFALSNWATAPASERESFDGRLLKARLLIQLSRGSEAVSELSTLRREAPEQRMAEVLLALGLAQSTARMFRPAEATLRAAREKGADSDLVEAAIGEVWLSSGRTREAETLLRKVLRRAPDMVGPMLNLAAIRATEGNATEAAALIRFAWQLGYQNPKELRATPEFERVRVLGLIDDLITTPIGRCNIY